MRARRPPARTWPVAALVLLLVTATDSAARRHEPKPRAGDLPAGWETRIRVSPESGPTRSLDGETYVGVNDLARLLDATKYWRSDVRKLVLRARAHRIQLTVDNPFALIDDRTVRLPAPVRSRGGELQVPVALVDSLPHDSTLARLRYDPGRKVVLQVPASGVVGAPQIVAQPSGTTLWFPIDRPEDFVVAGRARAHFRLRFSGFFIGVLPDTLAPPSLVRSIRSIRSAVGSGFELEVVPLAAGYRLVRDQGGGRMGVVIASRPAPDLEEFAPEGPPGPRRLRVVVLDPGHGGSDAGVAVPGVVEKDLTLRLARLLKVELERRLSARVVLTREDDRKLSVDQRAEKANRARADLVLSLHFDGFSSPAARGATVYCPPATFGLQSESERTASAAELQVLQWRDVGTRHAVLSRELAEAVLSSLELHDQGPTRLREVLPSSLLGVNAPGLMMECATLTSAADRQRLAEPNGLGDLAASIAEGVQSYQRNE